MDFFDNPLLDSVWEGVMESFVCVGYCSALRLCWPTLCQTSSGRVHFCHHLGHYLVASLHQFVTLYWDLVPSSYFSILGLLPWWYIIMSLVLGPCEITMCPGWLGHWLLECSTDIGATSSDGCKF